MNTVTPDAMGVDSSDYFSNTIFIENGIPIGAKDKLTTELYVSNATVTSALTYHIMVAPKFSWIIV